MMTRQYQVDDDTQRVDIVSHFGVIAVQHLTTRVRRRQRGQASRVEDRVFALRLIDLYRSGDTEV